MEAEFYLNFVSKLWLKFDRYIDRLVHSAGISSYLGLDKILETFKCKLMYSNNNYDNYNVNDWPIGGFDNCIFHFFNCPSETFVQVLGRPVTDVESEMIQNHQILTVKEQCRLDDSQCNISTIYDWKGLVDGIVRYKKSMRANSEQKHIMIFIGHGSNGRLVLRNKSFVDLNQILLDLWLWDKGETRYKLRVILGLCDGHEIDQIFHSPRCGVEVIFLGKELKSEFAFDYYYYYYYDQLKILSANLFELDEYLAKLRGSFLSVERTTLKLETPGLENVEADKQLSYRFRRNTKQSEFDDSMRAQSVVIDID